MLTLLIPAGWHRKPPPTPSIQRAYTKTPKCELYQMKIKLTDSFPEDANDYDWFVPLIGSVRNYIYVKAIPYKRSKKIDIFAFYCDFYYDCLNVYLYGTNEKLYYHKETDEAFLDIIKPLEENLFTFYLSRYISPLEIASRIGERYSSTNQQWCIYGGSRHIYMIIRQDYWEKFKSNLETYKKRNPYELQHLFPMMMYEMCHFSRFSSYRSNMF